MVSNEVIACLQECASVRGISLEQLPEWCEEYMGKEYADKLRELMQRATAQQYAPSNVSLSL